MLISFNMNRWSIVIPEHLEHVFQIRVETLKTDILHRLALTPFSFSFNLPEHKVLSVSFCDWKLWTIFVCHYILACEPSHFNNPSSSWWPHSWIQNWVMPLKKTKPLIVLIYFQYFYSGSCRNDKRWPVWKLENHLSPRGQTFYQFFARLGLNVFLYDLFGKTELSTTGSRLKLGYMEWKIWSSYFRKSAFYTADYIWPFYFRTVQL